MKRVSQTIKFIIFVVATCLITSGILCSCMPNIQLKKIGTPLFSSIGMVCNINSTTTMTFPFVHEDTISQFEYIGCESSLEIKTNCAIKKSSEYSNLYFLTLIVEECQMNSVQISSLNLKLNGELISFPVHCDIAAKYEYANNEILSMGMQLSASSINSPVSLSLNISNQIAILDIFYQNTEIEIKTINGRSKESFVGKYNVGVYDLTIVNVNNFMTADFISSDLVIKYEFQNEIKYFYSSDSFLFFPGYSNYEVDNAR